MDNLEFFTGSYGFDISIDTNLDLTSATSVVLKIKNPKGIIVQYPLDGDNFVAPLSGGVVKYTVGPADFGQPGTYSFQVFDITGGSKKLASNIVKVKIKPSIEYIES